MPIESQVNTLRSRILAAHGRGELNHASYKLFTMPYQYAENSLMGIAPYENTIVGLDAAAKACLVANFDGIILEVNGHDYLSRDEDLDVAVAALWCLQNGLEFGITSWSANIKDTAYKTMHHDIFEAFEANGVDKSSEDFHYILHHVFQPYENRLPEWVANTISENSRWLIEQVMPEEVPSISSSLDTDGDGISDLQEALNQTFPFEVTVLVFDDFSTYVNGNIINQTGTPKGFESEAWLSSDSGATLNRGASTASGSSFRTHRAFDPPINSGKVFIRANLALGTAPSSFQALELTQVENDGDTHAVRLIGGTSLNINVTGGGTGSGNFITNDGANHEWLIEQDLDTSAGQAWLDANTALFEGTEVKLTG